MNESEYICRIGKEVNKNFMMFFVNNIFFIIIIVIFSNLFCIFGIGSLNFLCLMVIILVFSIY